MTLLQLFLTSFAATVFVGLASRLLIGLLVSKRSARVAGLAVAFGFTLGRYSYAGPVGEALIVAVTAWLGAILALIIIWYWFFKYVPAEPFEGAHRD